MGVLEEAVHQALGEIPELVLSKLIEEKLAAQGIVLPKRALRRLRKQILEGGADTIELQTWKFWDRRHITLQFSDEDSKRVEDWLDRFLEDDLPALVRDTIDDMSQRILVELKRNWPAESRKQRKEIAGFRQRLWQRWGGAIERLRMLLTMSREVGSNINRDLRQACEQDNPRLVDVLTRLHARACQITEEVLCLLEAGLADGAIARWRSLHEVAVFVAFIHQHGEPCAERYVAHEVIESLKAARDYEACQDRLGYEPITIEELDSLQQARDAVVARFGQAFKADYGWAAEWVAKRKPSFKEIELSTEMDHLRAHYRMASHNVHANPKTVFFKLGLLEEAQVLLSGPSNAGLADPGHSTAISLAQVTATLILLQPTMDNLVAMQMMMTVADEAGEAFLAADRQLRDDAAAGRLS